MSIKDGKSKIWLGLMIVFLTVAVICGVRLLKNHMTEKDATDDLEQLQNIANNIPEKMTSIEETSDTESKKDLDSESNVDVTPLVEEPEVIEEPEKIDVLAERGIEIPEKNLDWDALHEMSEDIYSWIYIPDANSMKVVDYPVLQHPTDNSYYLNYNIDGSKGYPGAIYTEKYNNKDWSDIVSVLYGHNLKGGTMFSSLHAFDNEEHFRESDHFIFIYTEDYTYVYEIFAAEEYNNGHLLFYIDYANEYVFDDLVKRLMNIKEGRNGFAKPEIEVKSGDQLIVLSTCAADHDSRYRYLVVGKLINPRE